MYTRIQVYILKEKQSMPDPSSPLPDPMDTAFDKLSESARRAVRLAQEQARVLRHTHVGPEHLLLGLLRAGDSLCLQVVTSLHLSVESIRERVLFIIGTGEHPGEHPVEGEIHLTPAAKQVLHIAADVAKHSRHPQIDAIHLLMGLTQEKKSIGGRVLHEMGCTPLRVRKALAAAPVMSSAGGAKTNVVTCRLDDRTLEILDTLVEAGIRPTRSETVTWLIGVGLDTNRALVERVYATVGEIRRLRQEALGVAPSAEAERLE
jgi:ATP-dependent Clp protease ATP-binding subunit ClpC